MKKFNQHYIKSAGLLALAALTSGVIFTSCDDRLEEQPKTVVAENYYQTVDEIETATNAIYSPLRSVRSEQVAVLSAHTDWGYGRGSRAQYNDFNGLNATNANAAAQRWRQFYEGIRNANLVLFYSVANGLDSEEKVQELMGEAYFLRALTYFDLVRNWGGVPLRITENMEEVNVSRATEEQVYEQILADLELAEQQLPETAAIAGKPSVWAAKALLADVYLELENYALAAIKAQEIMNSTQFSLVKITSVEDLQWKLFGPDLVSSPEEVFSFKFTRQTGQGNGLPWIMNHPSTGLYNFGGAYAHYGDAANPFYGEWEEGDLRKQLWQQVDFGLGSTTLVNGKYVEPNAVDNTGAGNDLPIYRYAEVLLIFAEAEARATMAISPEAAEAYNQVLRRAYGLDPTIASDRDIVGSLLGLDEFYDLILQQKAYELQFEGKRWLDLKRTGRAQEFIGKNKGITIAEKHYLWPIPQDELNYNQAMDDTDQNPGY